MSDAPRGEMFGSSEELLKFLKSRVDDIDAVVIPVQPSVEVRGPKGSYRADKVGALIKLCNGGKYMIGRDEAAMLINDGVLQKLRIKCVLDPLIK